METAQIKGRALDATPALVAMRYCLYARKSTEQDEMQALSIDSQIKEMQRIAEKENLEVVDIRRESHSAKANGQRPVFNQIIADLRGGRFNAILTWAPDRLSRNAGDLGALVDLMDQKVLVEIRTYTQKFTNNPNEKFLLMILGSQAKLENDNKSQNVKRGLRTRVEMGLWPGLAPTGYLNEKRTDRKCEVIVDPKRAPVIKQMFEKAANEQWSGRRIYKWLKNDLHFTTRNGKGLTLGNIYRILRSPFYTGIFEYPKHSGNWYTGKHTPIITKELFEKVQQHLTVEHAGGFKGREFAFTKLMHCGLCGSGITAEEKWRQLKDGGANRHVYYKCTKSKDVDCKNEPISEAELIEQALMLIDAIAIDKIGLKEKLSAEIERYARFQHGVLGVEQEVVKKKRDIDIRNYAKYLLRSGNVIEQREILSCIKGGVVLRNKMLEPKSVA